MKQNKINKIFANAQRVVKNDAINSNETINDVEQKIIETQYTLYFDGCSKGNPGEAGAGAVIYKDGEEIWSCAVFVGEKETNNVAEYSGLVIGLNKAVELGIKNLFVKGDSQLVIKQMNKEYRVSSDSIKELNKLAKNLVKRFDNISFAHVYREFNKRADELSNLGLLKNPRYVVYQVFLYI